MRRFTFSSNDTQFVGFHQSYTPTQRQSIHTINMYYSSAVLQAVLLLSSATAILGEGSFSYDPDSADGPASWATLQIPENQCGGDAQSPINIVTSVVCDEKDVDYRFDVRFSCV